MPKEDLLCSENIWKTNTKIRVTSKNKKRHTGKRKKTISQTTDMIEEQINTGNKGVVPFAFRNKTTSELKNDLMTLTYIEGQEALKHFFDTVSLKPYKSKGSGYTGFMPTWHKEEEHGYKPKIARTYNFFTCPYCCTGYNYWLQHKEHCPELAENEKKKPIKKEENNKKPNQRVFGKMKINY